MSVAAEELTVPALHGSTYSGPRRGALAGCLERRCQLWVPEKHAGKGWTWNVFLDLPVLAGNGREKLAGPTSLSSPWGQDPEHAGSSLGLGEGSGGLPRKAGLPAWEHSLGKELAFFLCDVPLLSVLLGATPYLMCDEL